MRDYNITAICIILTCVSVGCGDDSASHGNSGRGDQECACNENETCQEDGSCKANDEGEGQGDDSCDPPCSENQTCVNGKCGICIGSECFFEGGDDEGESSETVKCEGDEDCGVGKICDNGACKNKPCVPACSSDEVCVAGKCKRPRLLWELCNNQTDCVNGECTYYIYPSKAMTLQVDGETQKFDSNHLIPVSLLDDRINAEYYNSTHPYNEISSDTEVGICTHECTSTDRKDCPDGWSCQLVVKGDSEYPSSGELPYQLNLDELESTPFAAICRPDVDEDSIYSRQLCGTDESACLSAGHVFYRNMCLESCADESKECPLMFSCETVEVDGDDKQLCVPKSGTCTSCYDHDWDKAGYGHCENPGVDCDDNDPNVYWKKSLKCSDFKDTDGYVRNVDENCNGFIDRFELLGTISNCKACGLKCDTPQATALTVTCESQDSSVTSDWYKSATAETEIPDFHCVEKCAFGYGDCSGNNTCKTALLTQVARQMADSTDDVHIRVSHVNSGSSLATIYALDEDDDGYPGIDNIATASSRTQTLDAEIVLSSDHSVICCSEDTNYCYTADKAWKTVKLSEMSQDVEVDGETKTIKYVRPGSKKAECSSLSPECYDSDDKDPEINPDAVERCDGKDNDGSRILLDSEALHCTDWCKILANNCDEVKDSKGHFVTNPHCDATPDGSEEPMKWTDDLEKPPREYSYGDQDCIKRHETGESCNDHGVVTCEAGANVRCFAGSDNCKCGSINNQAYIITEENHIVDPDTGEVTLNVSSEDMIRYFDDNSITEFCRCDGSRCDGTVATCVGDSVDCYELCSKHCTKNINYGLICTAEANSLLDGIDVNGELDYDGKDNNCNGVVDEDGWLPCVISDNADYDVLKNGVKSFIPYTDRKASDYQLPMNTDHSVNLCRIGMLKGTLNKEGDYIPICVPLYKPRDYDFYGDGIDSNCDGADYDSKNAVFVALSAQGASQGGTANSCKYNKDGLVSPCSTFNDALKKAKDSNKTFYHDIIVKVDEMEVASTSSLMIVPVEFSQTTLQNLTIPVARDLDDEEGLIHEKRFISPYALHRYLVKQKQRISSFDVNKYLFAYDTMVTKTSVNNETEFLYYPADNYEMNQPTEVIRIYGGFDRNTGNSDPKVPIDNDYWTQSTTKTVVKYTPTINENKFVYQMIQSELDDRPLSLLLSNLDFRMSNTEMLPKKLANGVTFIGIDGTHKAGTKDLTLSDTNISVVAPSGYSFGAATSTGVADDGYAADGSRGDHGRDANRAEDIGFDEDYVYDYASNNYSTNKQCGKDRTPNVLVRSKGGMGGYAYTAGSTNDNLEKNYGLGLRNANYGKDANPTRDTNYVTMAKGGNYKDGLRHGCNHTCVAEVESSMGSNGSGGVGGSNGSRSEIVMQWAWRGNHSSLYVKSDRSNGQGYYGMPGAGGGGGAVYRCFKGGGSDHTNCYGGGGGDGGCGGAGGEAGGTGGSAIGIAVKSYGKTSESTRLDFTRTQTSTNKIVEVKNGDGGKAQGGGAGGAGGNGGRWMAYAREVAETDTQCQGMGRGGSGGGGGAGGAGAGGRAGWAYPYVLVCPTEFSVSRDDFNDSDLTTLKNCGFKLPTNMINNAGATESNYGKQNLDGKYYSDASDPAAGKDGEYRMIMRPQGGKSTCIQDNENAGGAGGERTQPGDTQILDTTCKSNGNAVIIRALIK